MHDISETEDALTGVGVAAGPGVDVERGSCEDFVWYVLGYGKHALCRKP